MKRNLNQFGFSALLPVLLVIVVAVIGGVGYTVAKRNAATPNQAATQDAVANDVPAAPDISSADDLDKANAALDSTDTEGGDDLNQLENELNQF